MRKRLKKERKKDLAAVSKLFVARACLFIFALGCAQATHTLDGFSLSLSLCLSLLHPERQIAGSSRLRRR